MAEKHRIFLENRGIIAISGEESVSFLQGLVSNDVTKATNERAIYAAYLTPQGKFLFDFFILRDGDRLLLDCEADRADDLMRRLNMFKLRSKISLENATGDYRVIALIGENALATLGLDSDPGLAKPLDGGVVFVDPRLSALGARAILPRDKADTAPFLSDFAETGNDAYDLLRLELGIPDGARDLIVEKSLLMESGFDELNGIDWDKGCYMGQETTARTKHRGLVKKRLMPVRVDGPLPAAGTPVFSGEQEIGEMRSGRDSRALALIRLEALGGDNSPSPTFSSGEAQVTPQRPGWASF
ncbi:MAG: folate-binding protein YgfZ [Rhodospirillaceae bacterium]|nr:folate-binding protein YgfZ [Rhodospirillaceae bacterium]MBT5374728.1 folate-binding protein YgfZ [Rhodospirillaceae bacterium]MBT5660089.1 folate-binding protein YgfZ [Rhodospirillaceae bacterium]